MSQHRDDDLARFAMALAVALGLCMAVLSWWLGHGAPDPEWENIPDGGVLVGEDLCDSLDGGCADAGGE